jgi:hypothetical protein
LVVQLAAIAACACQVGAWSDAIPYCRILGYRGADSAARPASETDRNDQQRKRPLIVLPVLSRTILTAALMIGPAEAIAATHTIGLVGQTCETWTANPPFDGGLGLLYEQWMLGFLSGVSYADPDHDPLNGMDAGAVASWIDDYCRDNRAAHVADAAIAFIRAHVPMDAPAPISKDQAEANSPTANSRAEAASPVSNPAAHADLGQGHHPPRHAEPGQPHHSSRRCSRSGSGCPSSAILIASEPSRRSSAKDLHERPHSQTHLSSAANYRP